MLSNRKVADCDTAMRWTVCYAATKVRTVCPPV